MAFSYNFSFDPRDQFGRLNRALNSILVEGLPDAMERFGRYMVAKTGERFVNEQTPDGAAWAPLKRKTVEKRQGRLSGRMRKARFGGKFIPETFKPIQASGIPILQDTLAMRHSVRIVKATGHEVRIGIDDGRILKYAKSHQFGLAARKIPARPFLGFDGEDQAAFKGFVVAELKERMAAAR